MVPVVPGPSSCEKIFDTLHMWILALQQHQSLPINRNPAIRFWQIKLWLQYDLDTLLHGPPIIFADLLLYRHSEGGGLRQKFCTDHCRLFDMTELFVTFSFIQLRYLAHNNGKGTPLSEVTNLHFYRCI
jgi:hypothetical protein